MSRLTYRELQGLLAGLSELNAAHDMESFPARIIAAVKCVVAMECISIDKWNFVPGVGLMFNQSLAFDPAPGLTPTDLDIFAHTSPDHPLLAPLQYDGLATPRKFSDYLTTRAFHRTAIYNEFFRRINVDRQMSIGFPTSPTEMMTAAPSRLKRDYTESDRRSLAALRPHLIIAYRNATAFAGLQHEHTQLQDIIEDAVRGLIVLDADGHVRLITERARTLLHKYFAAPRAHADGLPEELTCWLSHRNRKETNDVAASPSMPLVIKRDDASCLRVRRLVENDAERVMLLLEETDASPTEIEVPGLTKREAEILSWVAKGKTDADIATLCDLGVRTVQKHLEHIYQKLGVETRTAAARRALEDFR